jgi:hypothetical protein
VIEEKDLFVEGERRLGRYTVVILRQSDNGRWMPSIMQLDATVTNYRLLLRPHRKKYEPASLPAAYIRAIELTRKGNYHCVQIKLLTDHLLFLMLSTGKLDDLHDDLKAMKAPPPKFSFDDKVAKHDIERLITFFGKEPLNQDEASS